MNKFDVIILSSTDFFKSYSGTEYFAKSLYSKGLKVCILCKNSDYNKENWEIQQIPIWSLPGFTKKFVKFSGLLFRVISVIFIFFNTRILITTDLKYFREALLFKKYKKNSYFIHYNQELLTPEEHPNYSKLLKIYEENIKFIDINIDSNIERSNVRKSRYKTTGHSFVLPNTLPFHELPERAQKGELGKKSGINESDSRPIFLFMGGANKYSLPYQIINSFIKSNIDAWLIFFCHGSFDYIEELRRFCEISNYSDKVKILNAIPRKELLSIAWEASAGIVYYPYSIECTDNQKYCAPTKFYEYMALGIPIISSNNPTLSKVIDLNRLGVSAIDDSQEGLANCFRYIFNNKDLVDHIKENSPMLFQKGYSYEVLCDPVIEKIVQIIKEKKP